MDAPDAHRSPALQAAALHGPKKTVARDQRLHNTRSLPSEETRSVLGGGGINVPPLVGQIIALLPDAHPCGPKLPLQHFPGIAQMAFAPSTGVVSNPTCIMQSAQRGSLPRPYFSHGVVSTISR